MKSLKCLSCNISQSFLICKTCIKDPFKIELVRRKLADLNDLNSLKTLYGANLAEISDFNSKEFWDEKLEAIQTLKSQDNMTKARIEAAFSFVPQRAQKILDIGAGYGFIEELFTREKAQYKLYGFDISPEAVSNLKNRFNGDFKVGSIYKIPFASSLKFDVILALEVFEHIPPSKILEVMKRIKECLEEGGVLIASVPVNESLSTMGRNPSGHLREYSLSLLRAELAISGFKINKHKEFSAFKNLYFLKDLLRKTILKNKWLSNDIVIRAVKIH